MVSYPETSHDPLRLRYLKSDVTRFTSHTSILSCNKSAFLVPVLSYLKQERGFKFVLKFRFKVARYSFSGPIPPKFEHKLRRHKQSFGKIASTVVLDEDGNLL